MCTRLTIISMIGFVLAVVIFFCKDDEGTLELHDKAAKYCLFTAIASVALFVLAGLL